jgi:hypothetical protein
MARETKAVFSLRGFEQNDTKVSTVDTSFPINHPERVG